MNVTKDNFRQEVQDYPGRVLIDFFTPGCQPCRMMSPILDEIAKEQGEKLKIVKIDAGIESELAVEFGVQAVPTLVLMNGGSKTAQFTGFRSKKDLEKWLGEN